MSFYGRLPDAQLPCSSCVILGQALALALPASSELGAAPSFDPEK